MRILGVWVTVRHDDTHGKITVGGRGIEGIEDRVGRVGEDTRSGLRYATRRRNALRVEKGYPSPEPNPNLLLY